VTAWKPRWVFHGRQGESKAVALIPYCTVGGGPANLSRLPDDDEILMPLSEGETIQRALAWALRKLEDTGEFTSPDYFEPEDHASWVEAHKLIGDTDAR
jgi:hypothetical protein